MKVWHMTCRSVLQGFRNYVRRQLCDEPLKNELVPAVLGSSYCPGASSNMVAEEQAGITCYANSACGFRGILKQRYTDFIVNEVDYEGNVVHLTCLDPSKEVIEGESESLRDDQERESLNLEKHLDAFRSLTGESDIDLLRGLLNNYVEGKKEDFNPIVLSPDSDKVHRTEVHRFFKSRFSFLVTDTVDGPHSTSKCVRVRILDDKCDGRRNNGKRMRGSYGRNKGKRQRHDDGYQGFDSRGADDHWPSQQGKYLQFHLYKENKDTQDTLMVIGKMLGMQPKSFGIAGTKDKRAVTTQKVTVFKQQASRLSALNKKLYGIKLGNFSYVDKALALGELSGNQFTITLRGVAAESDEIIREAAICLGRSGFINYFGLQRFGTGSVPTFTVGAALLRGEWEAAVDLILQPRDGERQDVMETRVYFQKTRDADGTLLRMPRQFVTERAVLTGLRKSPGNYLQAINNIPRTMRMMYVHSYQSYLWNHAASKRITLYGVDKVVEGDLVFCVDSANPCTASKGESTQEDDKNCNERVGDENDDDNVNGDELVFDVPLCNVKHVTADDVAFEKFGIHDVVLPLPGSKTLFPKNVVASTYEEVAMKDSLDLHQSSHNVKDFSFVHLPGSYRRLIQKAQGFDWKILKYDSDAQDLAETDWGRINMTKGKHGCTEQEGMTTAAPVLATGETELENSPSMTETALQLKFTLPSSCYATMALRELMKIPSSVEYHKALTEDASQKAVYGDGAKPCGTGYHEFSGIS